MQLLREMAGSRSDSDRGRERERETHTVRHAWERVSNVDAQRSSFGERQTSLWEGTPSHAIHFLTRDLQAHALHFLRETEVCHAERETVTYSVAISACEKGELWVLLRTMADSFVEPERGKRERHHHARCPSHCLRERQAMGTCIAALTRDRAQPC